MKENEIREEYFNWMFDLVCPYNNQRAYLKLLSYLHSRQFAFSIRMDANRAEDGVCMRYRFGKQNGYEDAVIACVLDCRPCSVLEMMVALSARCEDDIMSDGDIGDQTHIWFWSMINSMGLRGMNDESFDQFRTEQIVDDCLNRRYNADGKGGFVTVRNPREDMRRTEIWYQMMWYLDEYNRTR